MCKPMSQPGKETQETSGPSSRMIVMVIIAAAHGISKIFTGQVILGRV
jgi:hypothetical protein